jgi:hypothetical protein
MTTEQWLEDVDRRINLLVTFRFSGYSPEGRFTQCVYSQHAVLI